jgi:hypothetical protein
MTWTKTDSIGPKWQTWSPELTVVSDVANPTSVQWQSTISNFTWGDCKYAIYNGEFFGVLNFTMGQGSNYGGTRSHWSITLPVTPIGTYGKTVGTGFWHADTSALSGLGYTSDAAGRVYAMTWGDSIRNLMNISFIKTADATDVWALSNMSYSWGYVSVDGLHSSDFPSEQFYNTGFWNGSWHLFRLYRWTGAEGFWNASCADGTAGPLSVSTTAKIYVSLNIRCMIE